MAFTTKTKKRLFFVVARYFRFFANISFQRWRPRTVAITGSVGKTTMLGLVEAQIGQLAHYSHNANSAFGVAFDILGLKGVTGTKLYWLYLLLAAPVRALTFTRHEKFYVVEIDGERPHETEFIAHWLRPEVTIWVSLGLSHAVYYEQSVDESNYASIAAAIAHEFSTLAKYTEKLTLIDADSPLMHAATQNLACAVKKLSSRAIKNYRVTPSSAEFAINKHIFKFAHPMPRDIGIQLVMLVELMKYLRLPIKPDMTDLQLPPGRNNLLRGKNGLKIIDSSYNAHLISVASILSMVKSLRVPHKWLVIGDMIEQGKFEQVEHEKLADLIIAASPEQVVLVGRRTASYTYPLLEKRLPVVTFQRPQEALSFLEQNLTGKETVTFKGSQYLEWIIEHLLADPADAALLVRQTAAHRRRRASWGLT